LIFNRNVDSFCFS